MTTDGLNGKNRCRGKAYLSFTSVLIYSSEKIINVWKKTKDATNLVRKIVSGLI